jgi:hypothetical protein
VPPAGWNSTTVALAPQDPSVWPPTRQPVAAKPAPVPPPAKPQQPAKAKAAAVIPPALPPRPAPGPPPVVAASPAPATPPPTLAAAKIAGQPPLPTLATNVTVVPPPVPSALATASLSPQSGVKARLTATRWTKVTKWARQEWKFLAGGVGAGIALGGTVWLVLALQSPSAHVVAELPKDSAPAVATAVEPAPPAATAPPVGDTLAVPAADVEETSASKDLPTDPAEKLAGEPQDPSATTAPIAAKPADKPDTTRPAQAAVQPAATDEKTPPVASAPRPTIKLERAPAAPAATPQSSEVESVIDTGAADEADDTPAAVRTPAADSPGSELTTAEVDERLSRALPAAQFNKVPLFQFVEFVAEFTTLPIQLDEPALKRAGKSRQSAVTIKLNETTAGDALRTALSDLGLVTTLRSGTVVVTVAPDAKSDK